MKAIRLSLVTAITLLIISQGSAQNSTEDFVVLVNGDSLKGEVIKSFQSDMKFLQSNSIKPIKYVPDQVKYFSFRRKNEYYWSKVKPDEKDPMFMKQELRGKINVYSYYIKTTSGQGVSAQAFYLMEKGNSGLKEMVTGFLADSYDKERTKKIIQQWFSDNEDLSKRFLVESKLNGKIILKYIKEYNQGKP